MKNNNTTINQAIPDQISKKGLSTGLFKRWTKPLALFLSLSIFASSSNCSANEKPNNAESKAELARENQMQLKSGQAVIKKAPIGFNNEDVEGWGLVIASVEANKLGIDTKELIYKYSKEDWKLIRKLSGFFDTEEKSKQMANLDRKQKANEVLTEGESLIFEDYDQALVELREMLQEKN